MRQSDKHSKGLFKPGEPRLVFLESGGILCLLLNDELYSSLDLFVFQFRVPLLFEVDPG